MDKRRNVVTFLTWKLVVASVEYNLAEMNSNPEIESSSRCISYVMAAAESIDQAIVTHQ